jgi:hypothetical protein
MYEMMEILDPVNQNAYDKLQSALEQKICQSMPEDEWLSIWEKGNWEIEMSINFEKKHRDNDFKNGGFVNAEEERIYNLNMEGK